MKRKRTSRLLKRLNSVEVESRVPAPPYLEVDGRQAQDRQVWIKALRNFGMEKFASNDSHYVQPGVLAQVYRDKAASAQAAGRPLPFQAKSRSGLR